MLTDTLIATVLGLPLSVRLALLDADPKGAGWTIGRLYAADLNESPPLGGATWHGITGGCAWLPANPLVVLSVACALYNRAHLGDVPLWPTATKVPVDLWRLGLTGRREDEPVVFADHVDPLAAAVEVLREACRG